MTENSLGAIGKRENLQIKIQGRCSPPPSFPSKFPRSKKVQSEVSPKFPQPSKPRLSFYLSDFPFFPFKFSSSKSSGVREREGGREVNKRKREREVKAVIVTYILGEGKLKDKKKKRLEPLL